MTLTWMVAYFKPFSLEGRVTRVLRDYQPANHLIGVAVVEAEEAAAEELRGQPEVVHVTRYLPEGSAEDLRRRFHRAGSTSLAVR